ncbi:hypothetical protein ACSLV1_30815 [Pseudomonas aeruginosa]|uniref:DUF2384 domain-containing protein n=1 Tax=Pseudomonas paraeruginosa (strain DSM 24068 / PA7) TaxID=381754 RepID=A6V5S7_PSEP7|nr:MULTISPECIES: hypothetical protein [Pseudomonas aeruginosa group]ESR69773.1 hypothetical protein T266_18415 [Pseudomonas aeruginosa VRFPA05]ABR81194.1 hypothetical protein PSPA7_3052 [Pseudomonas aeruginosa PA7]EJV1367404.1 hypothetical protein [Pseudomonas aeruginosa]EJV1384120.1 hypothetical protein [Pseudomonas aeruginosa]EJV1607244.1 hypothetical protein [Pseudomonas aeruginosa]
MTREAFQPAAPSAAELNDHLRPAKGTAYSAERYAEVFGLSPAAFAAQLDAYRHRQPGAVSASEAAAAQQFIEDSLRVVLTVVESGVAVERAIAWFRHESLPTFEQRTAEQLVSQGQVEQVLQFLASWQAGSQG